MWPASEKEREPRPRLSESSSSDDHRGETDGFLASRTRSLGDALEEEIGGEQVRPPGSHSGSPDRAAPIPAKFIIRRWIWACPVECARSSLTPTQLSGYVFSKSHSRVAHPSAAHSWPQIMLSGCIILFNKHIFTTLNFPYVSGFVGDGRSTCAAQLTSQPVFLTFFHMAVAVSRGWCAVSQS